MGPQKCCSFLSPLLLLCRWLALCTRRMQEVQNVNVCRSACLPPPKTQPLRHVSATATATLRAAHCCRTHPHPLRSARCHRYYPLHCCHPLHVGGNCGNYCMPYCTAAFPSPSTHPPSSSSPSPAAFGGKRMRAQGQHPATQCTHDTAGALCPAAGLQIEPTIFWRCCRCTLSPSHGLGGRVFICRGRMLTCAYDQYLRQAATSNSGCSCNLSRTSILPVLIAFLLII